MLYGKKSKIDEQRKDRRPNGLRPNCRGQMRCTAPRSDALDLNVQSPTFYLASLVQREVFIRKQMRLFHGRL